MGTPQGHPPVLVQHTTRCPPTVQQKLPLIFAASASKAAINRSKIAAEIPMVALRMYHLHSLRGCSRGYKRRAEARVSAAKPKLEVRHFMRSAAQRRATLSVSFSKSRISVRSLTSAVSSGAGSGGCSFFSLFIPLITRNKAVATMRKFKVTVRN